MSFHQRMRNKFEGCEMHPEERGFSVSGLWSNTNLGLVKERSSTWRSQQETEVHHPQWTRTGTVEHCWVDNRKEDEKEQRRSQETGKRNVTIESAQKLEQMELLSKDGQFMQKDESRRGAIKNREQEVKLDHAEIGLAREEGQDVELARRQQRLEQVQLELTRQKMEEERRLQQVEEDRRKQEGLQSLPIGAEEKRSRILQAKFDDNSESPDAIRQYVERKLSDQRWREERRARRRGGGSTLGLGAVGNSVERVVALPMAGKRKSATLLPPPPPPPPPPRDLAREAGAIKKARQQQQQERQPANFLSQQQRWRMKRAEEAEKKEREWLEIKKLEEEQEEIMLRALEKQLHNERLTAQQQEVLIRGVRPAVSRPPAPPERQPRRPPPPPPLMTRLSVEEDAKLQHWEQIKRDESDMEERLMRSMEIKQQESLNTGDNAELQCTAKVKSQLSVEEERTLRQWEELKRRDSELEERMLREVERALASSDCSKEVVEESVLGRLMDEDPKPLPSCPEIRVEKSIELKTQLSVEEKSRLREWEDLRRRESEEEEIMQRQLERDLEAQGVELERRKFQEAIERQCSEEELRLQQDVSKSSEDKRRKAQQQPKARNDQKEWEQIRRMQEEQEEQARLLTERELEKQRIAQEQNRKMLAMADFVQLEERKKKMEDMTIHEEEDAADHCSEPSGTKVSVMDWEEINRRQEEEQEQQRVALERAQQQKNHSPNAHQQMLEQVRREREARMLMSVPIAEEAQDRQETTDNGISPPLTPLKMGHQKQSRISSGSEDDVGLNSEGCEELSLVIDLPIQEASSGNATPVPTTGELEAISGIRPPSVSSPPSLKSLLKKPSFDSVTAADSPLPPSEDESNSSAKKAVHFSEGEQVKSSQEPLMAGTTDATTMAYSDRNHELSSEFVIA